MKRQLFSLLIFVLFGMCSMAAAQETYQEPSTGKTFPTTVQIAHNDANFTLQLTGATVRKKFFFKVYAVAHYMELSEEAMSKDALLKMALTDGPAKQIVMDFARDVDAEKIQGAYREAFEKHTSPEVYQSIKPLTEQFIGYFNEPVKENDQFILQWLPGGTIIAIVKGKTQPAISNVDLAKALWATWLGKDSIVDRDKLVERVAK
jgi:hypothetical protein